MDQYALFADNIYEALKDCVKALGGAKVVGNSLWPEIPADDAGRRLANCLDRERKEKLDPEQMIYILREAKRGGCHIGMQFIAQTCEYDTPRPIEPDDKKAQLQQRFIQAVAEQKQILKMLESLS